MNDVLMSNGRYFNGQRCTLRDIRAMLRRSMSPETTPFPAIEDIAVRMNGPIMEGPPDLIPGLLPRQGQLIIAGATNVGKSLTAIEIASALTTGKPLWGQIHPTQRIRRVLYVLAEHYPEIIQRLYQKTLLPLTDEVLILGPEQLQYDRWLVAKGQPNLLALKKFQRWTVGCDLIVFDPLSAFVTGEGAEQDNITMRVLLDTMNLIAQTAKAACLVLAHQGKPMMDQFGKEHARQTYATRGASSLEDAATNIFYLNKDNSGDAAASAAPGTLYEMVCRKYKGESVDRFRLLRNPETLTHTLLANNAYNDVMKIDYQGKVSRLQASRPDMTFRDALRVVADVEGLAFETLQRRMGLKSSVS